MSDVWNQLENTFHPVSTSAHSETLAPGIYVYESSPKGWWLRITGDSFKTPPKYYGRVQETVERTRRAFETTSGNLGVLLSGLKGTGKSLTTQAICNDFLSRGVPVLVVSEPIPLQDVLDRTRQNLVVLFDEFEKTHPKTQESPDAQQQLLSTLDGVGRKDFKRLFLLTANEEAIDGNFLDRPGRIRYRYTFGALSKEEMLAVVDDTLAPEKADQRQDLMRYLQSRRVRTYDVVRAAVEEVNAGADRIEDFDNFLNLSKMNPLAWRIELLDEEYNTVRTITQWFAPTHKESVSAAMSMQRSFTAYDNNQSWEIRDYPCEQDTEIVRAMLSLPKEDTWLKDFPKALPFVRVSRVFYQEPPRTIPAWVLKCEKGEELSEEDKELLERIYDTNKLLPDLMCSMLTVRFVPQYEKSFEKQAF